MKRIRLLALAGSVLFCLSVASAQNGGLRFALTDLGTFGNGGYQSQARAINNNGQIVGYYLWSFKRLSGQGCFSKLPGQTAVVFGNNPCAASAVNASGAVAGSIGAVWMLGHPPSVPLPKFQKHRCPWTNKKPNEFRTIAEMNDIRHLALFFNG